MAYKSSLIGTNIFLPSFRKNRFRIFTMFESFLRVYYAVNEIPVAINRKIVERRCFGSAVPVDDCTCTTENRHKT